MFPALHLEIGRRNDVTERHFDSLCPPDAPGAYDVIAATTKGLCFVQMYAAWEYTVKNSVAASLAMVQSHAIPIRDVRLELASLLEMPRLKSIGASGEKSFWKNVFDFMTAVASPSSSFIGTDYFPGNGSQYRISQVSTIWEVFGIGGLPFPDPRLGPLVGEVVENRNAIAHGREPPENVGRRYSKMDVLGKIRGMRAMCEYVAGTLEVHCSQRGNLLRR